MLTCPMCKKTVRGKAKECPTCRTDLAILVDYLSDLEGGLERAEAKTRAGQLGEAVWAYLEVLEVDPDNPTAKQQIGQVVTAVRQFDEVMPGRRWLDRLRRNARYRRWKEDITDMTPRGWITLVALFLMMVVVLFVGYGWGWQAAQPAPEVETPSTEKDKTAKPTPPVSPTSKERPKADPKGPKTLGGR
jgi:hypothetical protein